MLTPAAAAEWLSQRLRRPVSTKSVLLYINAGDLAATNISAGSINPRWLIVESDLEALAARVGEDGRLPRPTGGWPYNYKPKRPKKADALAA